MGKSCYIRTQQLPAPSARSSNACRVWFSAAACGSGFAPKDCLSHLQQAPRRATRPIRWVTPTHHALHQILPIRCMLALRVRQEPARTLCRRTWCRQEADAASSHRAVAGSHSRASSRLHRLGHVSSQPGAARFQHPAAGQSVGRRGERGVGIVARHRHMWPLQPAFGGPLSRPKLDAGLPLRRQRYRVWTRAVLSHDRRPGHRASRGQRLSRSRLRRLPWKRPCSRSNNSKPTTTRRCPQWRLEVERARYEAEKAERRYRAVEPENRPGLLAVWKPNGRIASAIWPPPRRSCAGASNGGPASGTRSNSNTFRCSAPIFVRSGMRPPPPTAIAKNCCAHCWKKSS